MDVHYIEIDGVRILASKIQIGKLFFNAGPNAGPTLRYGIIPDLAGKKEFAARDLATPESFAECCCISVGGRCIEMPVAGLDRMQQDVDAFVI